MNTSSEKKQRKRFLFPLFAPTLDRCCCSYQHAGVSVYIRCVASSGLAPGQPRSHSEPQQQHRPTLFFGRRHRHCRCLGICFLLLFLLFLPVSSLSRRSEQSCETAEAPKGARDPGRACSVQKFSSRKEKDRTGRLPKKRLAAVLFLALSQPPLLSKKKNATPPRAPPSTMA